MISSLSCFTNSPRTMRVYATVLCLLVTVTWNETRAKPIDKQALHERWNAAVFRGYKLWCWMRRKELEKHDNSNGILMAFRKESNDLLEHLEQYIPLFKSWLTEWREKEEKQRTTTPSKWIFPK
ncbi:hypothetical protein EG68_12528 [Paragonimus skrjabini miyazakii]|uniref:Uncharacterized protein n=1 Tax=Paragonimus skrjabini miyazakii TaxID=59628 RepID=A0A8S9Y8A4_9TREM|nr:hypothetical protein EG68_12528 [Paragonimus skrjabini miyazakii]